MISLLTSQTRDGLKLAMDDPPQTFLNLPPSAKLLYLYLQGRGDVSWSQDEWERRLGATRRNLLEVANELDELKLITYTHGVGIPADKTTPPTLGVREAIYELGRVRELPEALLGERVVLKLIWLYLARSGLTLTTPELNKRLGLSWLATYNAAKDLNELELVEIMGKRPLKHKAKND